MYARLIVPAVLGAMLFAVPAFAAMTETAPATPSMATPGSRVPLKYETPQMTSLATLKAVNPLAAQRCGELTAGFDRTIARHLTAPDALNARIRSAEGGQLCASGMYNLGMAKIESAIHELGPLVG